MQPSELRVALFSGNYNYVRDGANQALNLLVGHLLSRDVKVRIYSPTTAKPAFPATGDLVNVPAIPLPFGRNEYRMARGLTLRVRRDLDAFAPNLVHVSAPEVLGHRALSWARSHGIATVASLHTRFETYPRYYRMAFLGPIFEHLLTRFYNRCDQVVVPSESMAVILRDWGVSTPIDIWSRGIDHDRFSPARRDPCWRHSLGIAEDDMVLGFLGRLVKEKASISSPRSLPNCAVAGSRTKSSSSAKVRRETGLRGKCPKRSLQASSRATISAGQSPRSTCSSTPALPKPSAT